MSGNIDDYIKYRIAKSAEAINDAKVLAQNKSWNACVNRLYYASYYVVSALLLKNKLNAQTHSGIKTLLNLHFIKTGKLSKEDGKLYSDLMDWRHKGDYGDMFDFDEETVQPLIEPVVTFIRTVEIIIQE